MSYHVKIGNISFCQVTYSSLVPLEVLAAAPREIVQTCAHWERDTADRLVEWLHAQGVTDAHVVEGNCDQRDSDYLESL